MKTYLYSLSTFAFMISCSPEAKQSTEEGSLITKTATVDSVTVQMVFSNNAYIGDYVWQEDSRGYHQALDITGNIDGVYHVRFSASVIKGKPGCSFESKGSFFSDTLKNLIEW